MIQQIQADGLTTGDRLPSIRKLSVRLGVGVNAVRDAVMQAQTLGLVKVRARSGAFVQSLNYAPLVDVFAGMLEASLVQVDHNLFHLLEARQLIEVELAGMAAQRRRLEDLLPVRDALDAMVAAAAQPDSQAFVAADVRFHTSIAAITGNRVLSTTLEAMLGLLRPSLTQLPWTPERRLRTDRSHGEIYQALVDGNAEQAKAHMRAHLAIAYDTLLARVQQLRGDGAGK